MKNFRSFRTPDSRLKEKRGGNGVGRLAWLKVFNKVVVDSTYVATESLGHRTFEFRLRESDQVHEISGSPVATTNKTTFTFSDFRPECENRCPVKPGVIETKVASHFVPLFLAGNAPKMTMEDDGVIDIEALFMDSIVEQCTNTITIEEDNDSFVLKVWSPKCEKKYDLINHRATISLSSPGTRDL
jgi:hypothetical protein